MYIILLWASLRTKVDLKSAVTSLLRTRVSASSASSGKLCNVCTLSAGLFWFGCFKGKLKRAKARHKRRKLRKIYAFWDSCAWKKETLEFTLRYERGNPFPVLGRASSSCPGPCSGPCHLEAMQRDRPQPDVWPSPAGIPLARCLWPHARLVLFLFWFSFLPRRDFSLSVRVSPRKASSRLEALSASKG